MSYAFDVTARVWAKLQERLPKDVQDSELLFRFSNMLEELHECDHRLRGQINHDNRVSKVARKLDEVFTSAQKGTL